MTGGGWISLVSNGSTHSSLRLPYRPLFSPLHPRLSPHFPKSLLLAHGAIRGSVLVPRQQLVLSLLPAIQHPAESGISTSKLGVNGRRRLITCHYLLLSVCILTVSHSLSLLFPSLFLGTGSITVQPAHLHLALEDLRTQGRRAEAAGGRAGATQRR